MITFLDFQLSHSACLWLHQALQDSQLFKSVETYLVVLSDMTAFTEPTINAFEFMIFSMFGPLSAVDESGETEKIGVLSSLKYNYYCLHFLTKYYSLLNEDDGVDDEKETRRCFDLFRGFDKSSRLTFCIVIA